jgi:hypothetical protein
VIERTRLNVQFALDCLQNNGWELDVAIANFEQVKVCTGLFFFAKRHEVRAKLIVAVAFFLTHRVHSVPRLSCEIATNFFDGYLFFSDAMAIPRTSGFFRVHTYSDFTYIYIDITCFGLLIQ